MRLTGRGGTPRCGIVLIVVLVIITMISLAGFGFLSGMSTEYEATKLNGSLRQAHQALASAESMALWFAGLSSKYRQAMGGTHHNPAQFQSQLVTPLTAVPGASGGSFGASIQSGISSTSVPAADDAREGTPVTDDRWRFSLVAMDRTPQRQRVLRFGLTNESAKISLARLLQWEQADAGAGRRVLMNVPGMTDAIADCLLDWIDADDIPREFGAESEYYRTLDRPCRVANAIPRSLTELLYVRGVSRELLAGHSAAVSGGDFFSGVTAAGPEDSLAVPWEDFLTLHSAERNQNSDGKPRVAVNAGTIAELEGKLAPLLSEDLVRYILLARACGLKTDSAEGAEPMTAPFTSGLPAMFSISSLADLIDSTVTVPTPAGNTVVGSPLTSASPDFAEQLDRLMDQLTVDPGPVITGRVNIRLASDLVVRMIPGMTVEQASQLIVTRDSLEASERQSVAWLITRNVLDLPTFRRIFPEITTGGDVFQTEIVVYRPVGGPMLRRNLILDAASAPARRVYWQDRTDAPLLYPLSLLSSLPAAGR